MGGASAPFWKPIIEHYGLNATITSSAIDPTFRFVPADWDGRIRMDCSSCHAMAGLLGMRDQFDIAFACDTDADRHGIVTRSAGLLKPNDYLAAAISYLIGNRPGWPPKCAIGKTVVSSGMIDRVAARYGRPLLEVPVGFKWFVGGLLDGSIGFGGEESAGATFLRLGGKVWTTDKDGILLGLLAAEITARTGRDPGEVYRALTAEFGRPFYERTDFPATPAQKEALKKVSADRLALRQLAGEQVREVLTTAPGNGQPFGGVKIIAELGGLQYGRPGRRTSANSTLKAFGARLICRRSRATPKPSSPGCSSPSQRPAASATPSDLISINACGWLFRYPPNWRPDQGPASPFGATQI